MKKILLLLIVLAIAVSTVSANTGLELSVPRYEPYPAQPSNILLSRPAPSNGEPRKYQIRPADVQFLTHQAFIFPPFRTTKRRGAC